MLDDMRLKVLKLNKAWDRSVVEQSSSAPGLIAYPPGGSRPTSAHLLSKWLLGPAGMASTHLHGRMSSGLSPPSLIPRSRVWPIPLHILLSYMVLHMIWFCRTIVHLIYPTIPPASSPNCIFPLLMALTLSCGSHVWKIILTCTWLILCLDSVFPHAIHWAGETLDPICYPKTENHVVA